MGLANALTVLRIILSFLYIFFFVRQHYFLASMVFLVAALSDFYDGYLARRSKSVSKFGMFMDPIADKVLVLSALFTITMMLEGVWQWMVWVVLARDVLVTIPRVWGICHGRIVTEVSSLGKIKTAIQMTVIFSIFTLLIISRDELVRPYLAFLKPLADFLQPYYNNIFNGLLFILVALTVYSGIDYLRHNWDKLRSVFGGSRKP